MQIAHHKGEVSCSMSGIKGSSYIEKEEGFQYKYKKPANALYGLLCRLGADWSKAHAIKLVGKLDICGFNLNVFEVAVSNFSDKDVKLMEDYDGDYMLDIWDVIPNDGFTCDSDEENHGFICTVINYVIINMDDNADEIEGKMEKLEKMKE